MEKNWLIQAKGHGLTLMTEGAIIFALQINGLVSI